MALDKDWFTEIAPESGSAFSLRFSEKLHDEKTAFQRIEVYATLHFGNLMVIDGCVMLSQRDNFLYHEMMSHPALFSHAAPRDVLIIGGGDCGTLQEVLRHDSVQSATQVEIDEQVTRVSERFFPELCAANDDPRTRLVFDDGIKWVADSDPESYDIIIVDSTDPVGPAEGLFRRPFYADCRKALRPGGILIQQSESPLLHMKIIQSMHQEMGAAGFPQRQTLHFPQCVYPSGWWSATLAGKDNDLTTLREQDIAGKPFKTRYYNLAIHRAAMAQPEFVSRALDRQDA